MTTEMLNQRLKSALDNFEEETRREFDEYSKDSVTKGEIAELSKQTFYALDAFRKEIIQYLDSNR